MTISAVQSSQPVIQLEVIRQSVRTSAEDVVYLVNATVQQAQQQTQQAVQQIASGQAGAQIDTYA
jgi:hypothetical protein